MKICITGKRGVGKTTFMNFLFWKNFNTYVADDYIHEMYEENKLGYNFIIESFGEDYILEEEINGKKEKIINRKKLNSSLLNNPLLYEKLNNFWIKELRKWIISIENNSFIELGIYLNFEKEFKDLFDKITLINRNRIINDEKHISSRLSLNKKIKFDYIIDNNSTIDEFKKNISIFLNSLNDN